MINGMTINLFQSDVASGADQRQVNQNTSRVRELEISKGFFRGDLDELVADTAGDTRGLYAVDGQQVRVDGTKVASGDYACITGGEDNSASGNHATVLGGSGNVASGAFSVCGGRFCSANASYATVSGLNNAVTGLYGTAFGRSHSISGDYASALGRNNNVQTNYSHGIGRNITISNPRCILLNASSLGLQSVRANEIALQSSNNYSVRLGPQYRVFCQTLSRTVQNQTVYATYRLRSPTSALKASLIGRVYTTLAATGNTNDRFASFQTDYGCLSEGTASPDLTANTTELIREPTPNGVLNATIKDPGDKSLVLEITGSFESSANEYQFTVRHEIYQEVGEIASELTLIV